MQPFILSLFLFCGLYQTLFAQTNYDCCHEKSPYEQGVINISLNGGIAPFIYTVRGNNYTFVRNPTPSNDPFITRLVKSSQQYHLPWTVGGEIGYMFRDNLELFADFDYSSASTKTFHFIGTSDASIDETYSTYHAYAGYLGVRFYMNSCWCSITPFVGGKIGFIHRNSVQGHEFVTFPGGFQLTTVNTLFNKCTVGSAGFQCGINWDFADGWQVALKGEVLVTGDWETAFISPPAPAPQTRYGNTGPILLFPVKVALRYWF